jgi:hypothetical protein
MAAWVPNMFCNFQFMKNHRNGNNSMMTHKAREEISTNLGSLECPDTLLISFSQNYLLILLKLLHYKVA